MRVANASRAASTASSKPSSQSGDPGPGRRVLRAFQERRSESSLVREAVRKLLGIED
ncbi:MAG TPA: hypothetical protein VMW75_21320 [Thermoanaerobaculia bacterium]|nr:hypothetical protein [Thermoanaerobaculia bacterium]